MVRVFVSNIGQDVELTELSRLFSRYGRVVDAEVRSMAGRLRSGYFVMTSLEEARSAARALDRFRLSDRELFVRVVRDM